MSDDPHQLLAELAGHEQRLQFTRFTHDTALQVGRKIVETARQRGQAVTVDVTRNDQVLFRHAMQGTTLDNAEWVRRKSNVVKRFGHSSLYVGTRYRARGTTFHERTQLSVLDYAAEGGAFPLIVKDVGVVGSVTVSGLSALEDHALVVEVLEAFVNP
jgi:uncharacterized protein (UPF0303 family)